MVNHISPILSIILDIKALSNVYEEDWGNITLSGNSNQEIYKIFTDFNNVLLKSSCTDLVKYQIGTDIIIPEEFSDYEKDPSTIKWKFIFSKQGLFEKKVNSQFHCNFFLESSNANRWLEKLDPIDSKNPINLHTPLMVIICDLKTSLGSASFVVATSSDAECLFPTKNSDFLPRLDKIQEYVHFISETKFGFDPNTYSLFNADYSCKIGQTVLSHSAKVLAICMVNEYYDTNNLIINGIKRLKLKLYDATDLIDFTFIEKLTQLIAWLYTDRIGTRGKLFNERLTLDIKEGESLIQALVNHIESALSQAILRYDFVVLDRKDAYIKELKDLLKDLRSQSDLYSLKTRTLLGNFLRDTLATLVLIGFTIFTKFTENIGLDKKLLLDYVFNGLGLFLLASMFFQLIVDITDLAITTKELKYWKKASNDLISQNEFDLHYKTIYPRKLSAWIIYSCIAVLYIVLAILCFRYPFFLSKILDKKA